MSTVLENYYDPNYEPTQSEIDDYGKWLGINLPEEKDILWIARDGLKAPLPENWKACKSEKGELYYFNFRSGQSIWDHPCDEQFKETVIKEREKMNNPKKDGGEDRDGGDDSTKAEGKKKAKKKKNGENKESTGKPTDVPSDSSAKSSPESAGSASSEENDTASRPGSKMAQLKVLKKQAESAQLEHRKPTVTVLTEPAQHASPHAKSANELAPVLKKKKEPTSSTPSTLQQDSPQPKNPNLSPQPLSLESANTTPQATALAAPKQQQQQAAPSSSSTATPATNVHEEARRFESEKNAAQSKFDKLLKQTKEQFAENHNRKVEAMQREFEKKLDDAREATKHKTHSDLAKYKTDAEAKIREAKEEMQAKHHAELADLSKKVDSELRAAHDREVAVQREAFDQELRSFKDSLATKVEAAKETVQTAAVDTDSFKNSSAEAQLDVQAIVEEYVEGVEALLTNRLTALTGATLDELRTKAEEKKLVVRKDCEAVIEKERRTATEAVEKYRAEVATKFDSEKQMSEARLEQLAASNKQERERMNEQHNVLMADLRAAHAGEKQRLESAFAEEISFLKDAHTNRLVELQQEMQGAFAERKGELAQQFQEAEVEFQVNMSNVQPAGGSDNGDSEGVEGSTADLLRQMPLPTDGINGGTTTTCAGTAEREASMERQAKASASASADLRTAIYEVLQDVLQAHPTLRPHTESPENNGVTSSDESPERRLADGHPLADVSNAPHSNSNSSKATRTKGTETSFKSPLQGTLTNPDFPTSYGEQHTLLIQEQHRVNEAREFLVTQRAILNERKLKLKAARKNWKRDVEEAKARGTTAGTAQAALLRKIQKVLDQQRVGLEHDEQVLRDSEEWLKVKEARVAQLNQDLEVKGDCDLSALSIDTQQLMAPLREGITSTPAKAPIRSALKEIERYGAGSAGTMQTGPSSKQRSNSRDAIERLEDRLNVVTQFLIAQSAVGSKKHHSSKAQQQAPSGGGPSTSTSTSAAPAAIALKKQSGSGKSTGHHHRRHRSSSGTRHVDFAAAYPTGVSAAWA